MQPTPATTNLLIRGKVKDGFNPLRKIGEIKMATWFRAVDSLGTLTHTVDGTRYRITITGASESTLAAVESFITDRYLGKVKTERLAA